jgi:hypothetical protein
MKQFLVSGGFGGVLLKDVDGASDCEAIVSHVAGLMATVSIWNGQRAPSSY